MLDTILREDAWGVMPEPLIRHLLREQELAVIKHTYGLTQETTVCLPRQVWQNTQAMIGWQIRSAITCLILKCQIMFYLDT